MATYTTNYNLEKPAQTDIYNVDVFNANADKIDAGLTDKAEKTMLAPVETTNSASRSYAKGEYFVYNNVLCCATTAIAAGGTIAIGTNCSTAPVGGELKSLRDALSTKSDWYYLLSNITATTTTTTHTLNSSRKLSDYRYLMFIMLDNSSAPLARCTMFLPRELYTNITGVTLSQVNSANQQFWIDVKRVSDTQLSIQSSSTANGYKVHVFGLYPVD